MFVSPGKIAKLQISSAEITHPGQQDSAPNTDPDQKPEKPAKLSETIGPRTQMVSSAEFDPGLQRLIIQQIHQSSATIISQFPSDIQLKISEYVSTSEDTAAPSVDKDA